MLLTISSAHEDVNLFALRQLMRATRGTMALHWMLDGYNRRTEAGPGEAGVRNLMGFVDGTANLHPEDDAVMDRYVWVQAADGEPAWATGGSYHVVRVIRMFVEFWDRTKLSEQEALIGRRKVDGAPLDGAKETDIPNFAADPDGKRTPLDAHIRLANPRTAETDKDLILRRGLSFSRGFDGGGPPRPGLGVRVVPAHHGPVPAHPGPAEGRTAGGVHPAPGRRLLLRPPGRSRGLVARATTAPSLMPRLRLGLAALGQ